MMKTRVQRRGFQDTCSFTTSKYLTKNNSNMQEHTMIHIRGVKNAE
jgi:hypothetical protein